MGWHCKGFFIILRLNTLLLSPYFLRLEDSQRWHDIFLRKVWLESDNI